MMGASAVIIGCGRMGRTRAECLHALGVRIRAVHDSDANRAIELASTCAAQASWDPDGPALSRGDMVFVCTPPGNRDRALGAALSLKLPIFLEKPLAVSLSQAVRVASLCADASSLVAVGYMNRYRASVDLAKSLVARGDALALASTWINAAYRVPWWSDSLASGGPINEQAAHMVDLIEYVGGPVVQVSAQVNRLSDEHVNCVAWLTSTSGLSSTLVYSSCASQRDIRLDVYGRAEHVFLRGWELAVLRADGAPPPVLSPVERNRIFHDETAAFVRAIVESDPQLIRSNVATALQTHSVVDAIQRAALEHRVVSVSRAPGLSA
jgi:myo-inositol 2-dehydrogenase/D-chiro-inositol 1-dehydrogenase